MKENSKYYNNKNIVNSKKYARILEELPGKDFPDKSMMDVTVIASCVRYLEKGYSKEKKRLNSTGQGLTEAETKLGFKNIYGTAYPPD
jgi:hypothetical protein